MTHGHQRNDRVKKNRLPSSMYIMQIDVEIITGLVILHIDMLIIYKSSFTFQIDISNVYDYVNSLKHLC